MEINGTVVECPPPISLVSAVVGGGYYIQQTGHQPLMVANPAGGLLDGGNVFRLRLSVWFRKTGSGIPSRVSPLTLRTQAESASYSMK